MERDSRATRPDAKWRKASSGRRPGGGSAGCRWMEPRFGPAPVRPGRGRGPGGPGARVHLDGRVMIWVEKSNRSRLILRRFCTSSSSSVTRIRSWSWPPSTLWEGAGAQRGSSPRPARPPRPPPTARPAHLLHRAAQHRVQALRPLQVAGLRALQRKRPRQRRGSHRAAHSPQWRGRHHPDACSWMARLRLQTRHQRPGEG